jgi:hypothetical protein
MNKNHSFLEPRLDEPEFRGGVDDVIIVPLVLIARAAKILLQRTFSILIRLLDYAFPLVIQLVRLPLFAARILGDGVVAMLDGVLRYVPISEMKRQRWSELIRQTWSWLRTWISYRVFEEALHHAFEGGMAWVFRKCRHLSPHTALIVIVGAILWLPISFGAATAMHVLLLAKAASWPAWMQLLHPLATILAKSKLLVLPVYPAAWPQAKKHSFIQVILRSYQIFKSFYLVKKARFRYWQTERVASAVTHKLRDVAGVIGITRAVKWFCDVLPGAANRGAKKPSQKVVSFFERWSIKFTPEYYEAKEREDVGNRV